MTPRPTIPEILAAVAADTGVAADDFTLTIHRRKRPNYVRARAIAAYELRQQLRMSYPEIARVLGFKSHVSVMHAVKTIYARTQHEQHQS